MLSAEGPRAGSKTISRERRGIAHAPRSRIRDSRAPRTIWWEMKSDFMRVDEVVTELDVSRLCLPRHPAIERWTEKARICHDRRTCQPGILPEKIRNRRKGGNRICRFIRTRKTTLGMIKSFLLFRFRFRTHQASSSRLKLSCLIIRQCLSLGKSFEIINYTFLFNPEDQAHINAASCHSKGWTNPLNSSEKGWSIALYTI